MYKEIQRMPEMISLESTKVAWSQVPSKDSFWEYTSDLEALYSDEYE
ncbi:MAG: hypothetical protein LBQ59_01485 [Candidatus Peribacteria bacterium]|jgi:hypothetical protein|nr:hypothetical protein [Candidatus Peribacteria bacterium]